ncbi:MAG: 2OG-Fe(II) oxygenase [Acidobacteria bacterium]|nr:2OG-Fe(II) oxygenase [Acidobacteriota bacterium]
MTEAGFERLRESLPDVSRFRRMEGIKRAYGQGSHNRYILHYGPGIEIAPPWQEFIAELQTEPYQSFVRRMFGLGPGNTFIPTLEWYYAWQGCSVSPHCDARRKLGTHIFYFNTEPDWEADWGGHILILDDEKRFKPHSGPAFSDFKTAAALDARGNESLLFERTDHSWHGVQPLGCPPGHLRKLFIITINVPTLQVWWRRVRGKDPDGYPLVA